MQNEGKSLSDKEKIRILMVCMGNICRSPTAHAVLRHKLVSAGIADRVLVDSAGTHAWHRGKPPDARALHHADLRGYDLSDLRARGVADEDFDAFDMILVMDDDNLAALKKRCPSEHLTKLSRLSAYAVQRRSAVEIPDPYYGGPNGFEHVLDLVEDACDGLVGHLLRRLGSRIA